MMYLISFSFFGNWCQKNTEKLAEGQQPKFSPSGIQIAYGHKMKIWTMDITGENKKVVERFYNANAPAWSPDGKKIVFQCYGENRSYEKKFQLWIMNLDNAEAHPLLESTVSLEDDQLPLWSPDGKKIVFSHGKQLWIVDSNGQNAHPLTKDPAKVWEYIGDWSPDSKFIAYIRVDSHSDTNLPQSTIWLIGSNGDGQRLFLDGVKATDVRWSRDGKYLYYSTYTEVWKIEIEGETPAEKIFEAEFISSWDISPDEKWIIYDNAEANVSSSIFLAPLSVNH